jgi:hypothetical protein
MSFAEKKNPWRWSMLPVRIGIVIALAGCVGWILNRSNESIEARTEAAGFFHGMFHGAAMPCALPGLLIGKEVVIYAPNNAGRIYNLGYTVGVNSCGAIFFGFFYWRLHRWRRQRTAPLSEPGWLLGPRHVPGRSSSRESRRR